MIVVLGALVACTSEGPTVPVTQGVILSSPVPVRGLVRQGGLPTPTGDSVVYVSLPPGSAPTGTSAMIRNLSSNATLSTPVFDGGFDPKPLVARTGDSVEVVVTDPAGTRVLHVLLNVRPLKPPVVVRTDPPRKKTDVPLNAALVAIFSEPMDPHTITAATLLLSSAGSPVAGSVTLSPDGIAATFQPTLQLLPSTSYDFTISSRVAALSGTLLEQPVEVSFVTTAKEPAVVSVKIAPETGTVLLGTRVQFVVAGIDSFGWVVRAPSVTWSSSDTAVAEITPSGSVTTLSTGAVTISARWSRGVATAALTVKTVSFASISAGVFHTCAVTTEGEAYCWGDNDKGELGAELLSPRQSSPSPVRVAGGLTFSAVSVGDQFTCGLTTDDVAYCWGDNEFAQLGDGSTTRSSEPVQVAGGLRFTSISAGIAGACALTASGAAYCWGANWSGEVGDSSANSGLEPSPRPVAGGVVFRSITLGLYHTCGLSLAGQVYCWGYITYEGITSYGYPSPMLFDSGPVKSLGATLENVCVVALDGTPYCSGTGHWGNLGNDSLAYEHRPVPVTGGVHVESITAGQGSHTCGILADGSLICWGANDGGQLGVTPAAPACSDDNGQPASCSKRPIPGAAGFTFASVSAGQIHTCGIGLDGIAYCWGSNAPGLTNLGTTYSGGELGDGTTTSSWKPVRVLGQR
jgi:alpha-tubulin suppressor-like RCC1 family protein